MCSYKHTHNGAVHTAYQYETGQISATEAALDFTFGGIGFLGGQGAAISIGYFGSKAALEYSGYDVWNWKVGRYGQILR